MVEEYYIYPVKSLLYRDPEIFHRVNGSNRHGTMRGDTFISEARFNWKIADYAADSMFGSHMPESRYIVIGGGYHIQRGVFNYSNGRYQFRRGNKQYELSNHLGNVLTTIQDRKWGQNDSLGAGGSIPLKALYYMAYVATVTDYYAFGSGIKERTYAFTQKYRFSMNTQEKEPELGEGVTSAEFWVYDGKLGRRWNVDPVIKEYESPYSVFANNPIIIVDYLGNDSTIYLHDKTNKISPEKRIEIEKGLRTLLVKNGLGAINVTWTKSSDRRKIEKFNALKFDQLVIFEESNEPEGKTPWSTWLMESGEERLKEDGSLSKVNLRMINSNVSLINPDYLAKVAFHEAIHGYLLRANWVFRSILRREKINTGETKEGTVYDPVTKSNYSVDQGHWNPGVMNNSGRNIVINENLMMQGSLHSTYLGTITNQEKLLKVHQLLIEAYSSYLLQCDILDRLGCPFTKGSLLNGKVWSEKMKEIYLNPLNFTEYGK